MSMRRAIGRSDATGLGLTGIDGPGSGRAGGTLWPMPEGFHPPLEEYLEAIHELGEEGMAVIQARLAERLGHSRAGRLRDDPAAARRGLRRGAGPVAARSPTRAGPWPRAWCASTGWPSGC